MDIKFKPIVFNSDFDVDTGIQYFEKQLPVFEGMSRYLVKRLDIPSSDLKNMIMYCAYTWQKNYDGSFSLYENAILQEKLILADQFRDEVISNLKPFLLDPNDFNDFKEVVEKALLYYMKEYS